MSTASKRDYTRWNRAGLTSMTYVDGNAATYLDDLNSAMLAQFLQGETGPARTPEFWSDVLATSLPPTEVARLQQGLTWKGLMPDIPPQPASTFERNRRLLAAYLAQSPDYAEEIMRAFARAAHVLLGHVNAYANEGYLRTATQWETARKLAAMAGYQPAPAASATINVALIARETSLSVEVLPGLQMSAKRADGKPLIFETIEPLHVHPALNAVRVAEWNTNPELVDPVAGVWLMTGDRLPKTADIAVVIANNSAQAVTISNVVPTAEKTRVTLGLSNLMNLPAKGVAKLCYAPALIKHGEPVSSTTSVYKVANASAFEIGGIALVSFGGSKAPYRISNVVPPYVFIPGNIDTPEIFQLIPLMRLSRTTSSSVEVPASIDAIYKLSNNNIVTQLRGSNSSAKHIVNHVATFHEYALTVTDGAYVWAELPGTVSAQPTLVLPPSIVGYNASNTVGFVGKPPKGLEVGSVFVARNVAGVYGLTVEAVQTNAENYTIAFKQSFNGLRDATEFHGPMTEVLRAEGCDRNPNALAMTNGRLFIEALPAEAKAHLRLGRKIVVEDERPGLRTSQLLTCDNITTDGVAFLDSSELSGFQIGWTLLRMNCVNASHGEDQGPRILGSGDGSKRRQSFPLSVQDISFIPSSLAESGVIPAIEVRINGEVWDYRDYMDLDAEDTRSYSIEPLNDGTLQIHFRRRLPTGTNNIMVTRHRIGSGPDGNGIAPYSFKKPEHKHEAITAIVQPIAPAGGAVRESAADMRINAPARLAANGRAVSVEDYARLARRHASVWQARADYVSLAAGGRRVQVVVVPANYAAQPNPASYYTSLYEFLVSRNTPDMPFEVVEFDPVHVRIQATIRVDSRRFDREKVKDASTTTLLSTFGLNRRKLGQSLHIGEILASLETVDGLDSAVASFFVGPHSKGRFKTSAVAGLTAYFATRTEVAYLSPGSITLQVENPS